MADAAYLQSTVSGALSDALAATVEAQPEDPVAYLGNYLLAHVRRMEAIEKVRAEAACIVPTFLVLAARPRASLGRWRPCCVQCAE